MPLPKDLKEILTIDYTEMYKPPLNLPRNITDKFNKVLLSGDITAIDKYYREVVLPYNYMADEEREQVKKWDREATSESYKKKSRKSVEVRRKAAQDHYLEWQEEADMKWEKNPGLSRLAVAGCIIKSQKAQKEYDDKVKVYSVDTIRRIIKKK